MSRQKRKMAPNGRNLEGCGRFILLARSLLHSPHFSVLSVTSRALMIELHGLYNGVNNGTLFLSVRDAAARLGLSDLKAVKKAFDELVEIGFLTQTVGASFHIKADRISKARAWHLNWIKRGRCVGRDAFPPLNQAHLSKVKNRRVAARMSVIDRYHKQYSADQFSVEKSTTISARMAYADEAGVENASTDRIEGPRQSGGSVS